MTRPTVNSSAERRSTAAASTITPAAAAATIPAGDPQVPSHAAAQAPAARGTARTSAEGVGTVRAAGGTAAGCRSTR